MRVWHGDAGPSKEEAAVEGVSRCVVVVYGVDVRSGLAAGMGRGPKAADCRPKRESATERCASGSYERLV